MLLAVLSGFFLALIAPSAYKLLKDRTGWVLALLPAALFAYFAQFVPDVAHGETITQSIAWVSTLDVSLDFVLDGLSLLMALIITGVGTLIYIYGQGYLHGDPLLGRFYLFLSMFMAAMLGVVLADNLMTLFVFWELTSISSYLLIGYKHKYEDSRAAALKALVVTGAGGLAMLAGFVLLALAGGSWQISALDAEMVRESDLYLPILVLVGLGAFTKSAQFPFHIWLPGAMAAPTPVSAYLHSATMVKAGVYLLARLSPTLSGTDAWLWGVTLVGAVTMLVGAYLSIKQDDLKRILAYSTVSSLGMLVMLIGWGTKVALEAAMLFLLVHSLYKGTLFMAAGAIDHETGTRDIRKLGGLLRVMPFIALASFLAALSMSGIPPFLGFIGKELIYEATLEYEDALQLDPATVLLTAAAVISNMAAIAVACMVTITPFTGEEGETPKHPHRAPFALWLGPVVMGVTALAFGLLADPVGEFAIGPAAGAAYGEEIELHLALWHGITPMLILSIITVAGGVLIFSRHRRLRPALNRVDPGATIGPDVTFDHFIERLPYRAKVFTLFFQRGYIRYYVLAIVATLLTLVSIALIGVTPPDSIILPDVRFYEVVIALVILLGVGFVLLSRNLLYTVAALGVVGYGIALIFMLYGAPDLAITQFAIETLTVVLFVLVLFRLPELRQYSNNKTRARDALIAGSAGVLIATLVLFITAFPLDSELSNFFTEVSYSEAQGRNIVNVILVDFRGIDTLGEITVLSVAAIGVYALLNLPIDSNVSDGEDPQDSDGNETNPADFVEPDVLEQDTETSQGDTDGHKDT